MKALSLHQPWASLVVEGRKKIETRSWGTKYRGQLAIHAAKTVDEELCALRGLRASDMKVGAVLGVVTFVDCVQMTQDWIEAFVRSDEKLLGLYRPGRWAWMLRNPMLWDSPLPTRGYQGLFEIER